MDRDRADVGGGEPLPEEAQIGGRFRAASPGCRVVREDLDSGGADRARPLRCFRESGSEREMGADPAPAKLLQGPFDRRRVHDGRMLSDTSDLTGIESLVTLTLPWRRSC